MRDQSLAQENGGYYFAGSNMSRLGNLLITQHRIERFCFVCNFFNGKAGDFGATLVTLGANAIRVLFSWTPWNDR